MWSGPSVEECIQVWKWVTGSRLVALCQNQTQWFLRTGLLPDQMHLAQTWPPGSDLGQFYTIWSGPSLEEKNWIGSRIMIWPNSGCTINGHYQNVPNQNQGDYTGSLSCFCDFYSQFWANKMKSNEKWLCVFKRTFLLIGHTMFL